MRKLITLILLLSLTASGLFLGYAAFGARMEYNEKNITYDQFLNNYNRWKGSEAKNDRWLKVEYSLRKWDAERLKNASNYFFVSVLLIIASIMFLVKNRNLYLLSASVAILVVHIFSVFYCGFEDEHIVFVVGIPVIFIALAYWKHSLEKKVNTV